MRRPDILKNVDTTKQAIQPVKDDTHKRTATR